MNKPELRDQMVAVNVNLESLGEEWICPIKNPPESEKDIFWVIHENGHVEMARFNNYTKYNGWHDTWQDLNYNDFELSNTKYSVIEKPNTAAAEFKTVVISEA